MILSESKNSLNQGSFSIHLSAQVLSVNPYPCQHKSCLSILSLPISAQVLPINPYPCQHKSCLSILSLPISAQVLPVNPYPCQHSSCLSILSMSAFKSEPLSAQGYVLSKSPDCTTVFKVYVVLTNMCVSARPNKSLSVISTVLSKGSNLSTTKALYKVM
jgi:hypothetical protein